MGEEVEQQSQSQTPKTSKYNFDFPPEPDKDSSSLIDDMMHTDIFRSIDSVGLGSYKLDFLELFRSGSSHAGSAAAPCVTAARNDSNKETTTIHPGEHIGNHEKPEPRSRSSSLATEGSAELSICPHEAEKLANAGLVADGMHQNDETAEEEREPVAIKQEEENDNENAEAEEPELVVIGTEKSEDLSDEQLEMDADDLRLPSPMEPEYVDIPEQLKPKRRKRKVYEPEQRVYTEFTGDDVLCQRGGKGNVHEGNRRFRAVKDELQAEYFNTPKLDRTRVSQKLVDMVHAWGGRFLRKDAKGWYEVHNHVARTKAGQALRETYTAEDRAAKRLKYTKKKKKKQIDSEEESEQ